MSAEDQKIRAGFFPARTQLLVALLRAAEDEAVAKQGLEGLTERVVSRQYLILSPSRAARRTARSLLAANQIGG